MPSRHDVPVLINHKESLFNLNFAIQKALAILETTDRDDTQIYLYCGKMSMESMLRIQWIRRIVTGYPRSLETEIRERFLRLKFMFVNTYEELIQSLPVGLQSNKDNTDDTSESTIASQPPFHYFFINASAVFGSSKQANSFLFRLHEFYLQTRSTDDSSLFNLKNIVLLDDYGQDLFANVGVFCPSGSLIDVTSFAEAGQYELQRRGDRGIVETVTMDTDDRMRFLYHYLNRETL